MRSVIVLIVLLFHTFTAKEVAYIDELENDGEGNENGVLALNEGKRSVSEKNEPNKNVVYTYHDPIVSNIVAGDDLMAVATDVQVKVSKPNEDADDLMAMRDKRDTNVSFKQIHDFMYSTDIMSSMSNNDHKGSVSNERRNELTATATLSSAKATKKTKKKSKRKRATNDTKGEMSNIFSGIQSAKHHKLTRSDIRKLAKKAVILATLKKLNDAKSKNADKKLKTSKKTTKKMDKKSTQKKSRKNKSEKSEVTKIKTKPTLSISGKDMSITTQKDEIGDTLTAQGNDKSDKEGLNFNSLFSKTSKDTSNKASEMSEDLTSTKKNTIIALSDDKMSKKSSATATDTIDDKTPSAKSKITATDTVEPKSETSSKLDATKTDDVLDSLLGNNKKTTVEKVDESTKIDEAIFDGENDDPFSLIDKTKKSELPSTAITDQMKTLRNALGKTNPNKVPEKFFPDLPSGIRMIAWKKLLIKKKKQLAELEAAVSATDTTPDAKPVMVNIDIDHDKIQQDNAISTLQSPDITEDTTEKKENDQTSNITTDAIDKKENDHTSTHVHYLQKHISGARALRKLIAKTLIGHCKTTGKRILKAFVAMDKALARAQAIATVIGRKFKIDPAKIETLVGGKEDQVVETFLRDIFTKI